MPMTEPHLSEFRALIRSGAAARDIHDAGAGRGYARDEAPTKADGFLDREVRRVESHQRTLLPLLEQFVGPCPSILDVGCSSGGTTVALALSGRLGASRVIGVDPNDKAIAAAAVRAAAYGLSGGRVRFLGCEAGQPLPFAGDGFDLTVCNSVLEFVTSPESRGQLIAELVRVTRPGGYVYLATPSPLRLREHHSRRWLGDWRRRDGFPWSSRGGAIRRMFAGCDPVPIRRHVAGLALARLGLPGRKPPAVIASAICLLLPWQKFLWRKR